MFQTHVPKSYKGEVVLIVAYLINQIPSKVLGFKSLLSGFSNHFLNSHITCKLTPKVFGYVNVFDHLKESGMLGYKPIDILIEPSHKLSEASDDTPMDRGIYW